MRNRTKALRQVYFFATVVVAMLALFLSSTALYERTADAQAADNTSLIDAFKAHLADDLQNSPDATVKLTANDAVNGGRFGSSVAISGDTAIIGATNLPQANGGSIPGAAYIFVRNGGSWAFQQKLTANDAPAGNGNAFGDTVGISGDTVVVAAPQHDSPESYSGGVYVFVRNGTTWTLQKRFTNSDTPLVKAGKIGYSVAISGDTVLVSAFGFLQASPHRHFVHVFVREGATWTLQTTIITGGDESFDARMAISGDVAVIGEPNRSGTRQNAAYIYVRCGTEWTQQQRLTSTGPQFDDFGNSVAISGNTVIVGARTDQIGQNQTGAAYIFVNNGTTWTQQAKLLGAVHRLNFGHSVAIMGDTAIVGAPRGTFAGGTQAGGAEVFVRTGTSWNRESTITSPDGQPSDGFGSGVAISPDTVIVGAPLDDLGSTQTNEGSAWVIDRTTAEPPPAASPCDEDIEVNITSDEPDADLEDDLCDVNVNQTGLQCSLRAAIQTANAKEGPDEIKFNIPGGGTHSISPLTQLPSLSDTATIDATTQPGYAESPLIELRGNSSIGGIGFVAGSENSILRGMAINRFGIGIGLQTSGVRVERCYFGLSPDGNAAGTTEDQVIGIEINNGVASNNTIGGVGTLGNVISNNGIGIRIASGATLNKVIGNRIGTNTAGTRGIANTVGVVIEASSSNMIGDIVAGSGNVISGNAGAGIYVRSGASNNKIAGNLIGTNAAATEAVANANGVIVEASSNNRIGSDTGTVGNVISGNTFAAVTLKTGASGNSISGNKIGTNTDGTAAIPNRFGVGVDDTANGNTIGDPATAANGNLISANTFSGVVIQGNSANNRVSNNSIGTKASGTEVLPNGEVGILITGGGAGNTLEKNVIGGHNLADSGSGIGIAASAGPSNMVYDNFIGVARNGTTPLPNYFGIGIAADGQTIGSAARRNTIGHNLKAGIVVAPATGNAVVENNTIEGNLVGTNGSAEIGNDEFGVWINGAAQDNLVKGNYLSGNTLAGVGVTDEASSNDILDNFIGVNVGSMAAVPNGIGIWIRQSTDNMIAQNVVAGNDIGMLIGTNIGLGESASAVSNFEGRTAGSSGTFTSGNRVYRNIVGVGPSGAIPNRVGIALGENARNNFLGAADGANLISGNTTAPGWGMLIGTLSQSAPEATFPQLNLIQSNRIGTTPDLTGTVPNTVGMVLVRALRNTIGGDSDNLANFIMASTREGVLMSDGAGENIFLKNYMGMMPTGPRPVTAARPSGNFGNGSHGILIENGAYGNILGGSASSSGLVIADNGGNGIRLASTAGSGNRMGTNSVSGNALAGVDIGGDGVTPNDPTDADTGPNNLQNYPTLALSVVGGDLIVSYQVDSAPQHSAYGANGLRVEFFEADATGAGRDFLGFDHFLLSDYQNGAPGTRQKNLGNAAALGIVAGDRLTATATDAEGNSSEFTPAVVLAGSPVTIGGRVTTPSGLGLRNAIVTLVDPSGVRRTATTSSFGIYSFANVPAGQSYTISVASKRYRFAPRIQTIDQSLSNLDFVGLE